MKMWLTNIYSGYSLGKILTGVLVVILVLPLLLTIPGFPIRLVVRHRETFISAGKDLSERLDFGSLFSHGRSTAFIENAIKKDPWAFAHLRGKFGLELVDDAAHYGRQRVLRMLLSNHALVNGRIDIGDGNPSLQTTPLDEAISFIHPGIIRILLAAGADPYEQFSNIGGVRTPYQDAMGLKNPKIVEIFKALKQRGKNNTTIPANVPVSATTQEH